MRNLALKTISWAQARQPREQGQTVIEYALVVAIVSVVLAGLMVGFGTDIINAAKAAVTDAIS